MELDDSTQHGTFGTLQFIKRTNPDAVIRAYPIDSEEVTIGRDQPNCDLRLYYDTVSPLHAKIVFHERKAFLEVHGKHGLLVDSCPVLPAPPPSTPTVSSPSSHPTTVPLPNNAIIEIAKKCFRFVYPPKDRRAAFIASPAPSKTPGRKLRLSMIASAQVFTPRPSADPRENLRVLQSPIKAQKSPLKHSHSAPVFHAHVEEEPDQDIVLVEGNQPNVTESERDLVILEDVEDRRPSTPRATTAGHPQLDYPFPNIPDRKKVQTPRRANPIHNPESIVQQRAQEFAQAAAQNQDALSRPPPRTPPRPTLHRMVLVRSAHRTAIMAEEERQEQADAKEVEKDVLDALSSSSSRSSSSRSGEEEDAEVEDDEAFGEGDDESEEALEAADAADLEETVKRPVLGWRRSLEAVKGLVGFRSSATPEVQLPEREEAMDVDEAPSEKIVENPQNVEVETDMDANAGRGVDREHPSHSSEDEVEQVDEEIKEEDEDDQVELPQPAPASRRPLGSFMTPQQAPRTAHMFQRAPRYSEGGARRVPVTQTWRVRDLVVDSDETLDALKEEAAEALMPPPAVPVNAGRGHGMPIRRENVTAEERKAISERRRSALTAPDQFFGGAAPGTRRASLAHSAVGVSPAKRAPAVPLPPFATPLRKQAPEGSANMAALADATEPEDTRSLLEKMKETVAGLRASSPRKLSPPDDVLMEEMEEDDERGPPPPDSSSPEEIITPARSLRARGLLAPRTPAMDGMRHLFGAGEQRPLETPALEGVGEMMATPPGDRAPPRDAEDDGEGVIATAVTTTKLRGRAAGRRAVGRTPATGTSQFADDEATPTEGTPSKDSEDEEKETELAKPKRRILRGRKATDSKKQTETQNEQTKKPPASRSRSRSTTRVRKTTEEPPEVPPLPSRRITKASSDEQVTEDSEQSAPPAKPAPPRRGRKAASTEPSESEQSSKSSGSRRAPKPASKEAPAKAKSSRGTRAAPIAVNEEDNDPLDVMGESAEEPPAPAPAPVKRRGRPPKVKAEPRDDDAAVPASTRTAKKPAATSRKRTTTKTDDESAAPLGSRENLAAAAEEKRAVETEKPARKTRMVKEVKKAPASEPAPANARRTVRTRSKK